MGGRAGRQGGAPLWRATGRRRPPLHSLFPRFLLTSGSPPRLFPPPTPPLSLPGCGARLALRRQREFQVSARGAVRPPAFLSFCALRPRPAFRRGTSKLPLRPPPPPPPLCFRNCSPLFPVPASGAPTAAAAAAAATRVLPALASRHPAPSRSSPQPASQPPAQQRLSAAAEARCSSTCGASSATLCPIAAPAREPPRLPSAGSPAHPRLFAQGGRVPLWMPPASARAGPAALESARCLSR